MTPIPDIKGTLLGKDVSYWQTPSDWAPGPLHFLIARASIGTTPDTMYDRHINKALKAGLPTGAYHYNWASVSVKDQVRTFLDNAHDASALALDVEGRQEMFSHAQTREFIDRVHDAGRQIGLYMSASQFFDAGQDWDWIAHWGIPNMPRAAEVWQFGGVGGEDGNLARNQDTLNRIFRSDFMDIISEDLRRIIVPAGSSVFDINTGKQVYTLPDAVARVVMYRVALPNRTAEMYAGRFPDGRPGVTLSAVRVADCTIDEPVASDMQAEVDAANAQIAALLQELDETRVALDEAAQAAEVAPSAERERIASREADRIRSL